jgi:hypothetical protein
MTKLKTAVQTVTFEMTPAVESYLQEQMDFLAQHAVNQIGTIANYANIAGFQALPTFQQMFGDDFGLANDSNQRQLKYCAQTVANSPDMLVQLKPSGNVYGAQEADGVQHTVFSDTDRNKIQLSEFGYKVVSETAERFAKTMTDVSMLHANFGIVPTTSRKERYELFVANEHAKKRSKQEMQSRTESKFQENKQHNECILQLVQVANATAHLV